MPLTVECKKTIVRHLAEYVCNAGKAIIEDTAVGDAYEEGDITREEIDAYLATVSAKLEVESLWPEPARAPEPEPRVTFTVQAGRPARPPDDDAALSDRDLGPLPAVHPREVPCLDALRILNAALRSLVESHDLSSSELVWLQSRALADTTAHIRAIDWRRRGAEPGS